MKIATLQLAPRLGDVKGNIRRANELLERGKVVSGSGGRRTDCGLGELGPEVLVLPELALTG